MIFDSGDTSKSIHVFIADDAGAPVTGLTYLTAPTISYWISGNNAAVPVTLADLAALTTAWASGGFKEIGVGMYRFDIPNAALASAGKVLIYGGTSGKQMYPVTLDVGAVPTAAAIATAVWNALTSGLTTSGSIGKRLVEFVTSLVYATPLDAAGTRSAIGLASADLDTQLSGISAKTDNLPASPAATGDEMDLINAPNSTALTAIASQVFATTIDGVAYSKIHEMVLAFLAGKVLVSDNGTTTTLSFKKRDGSTEVFEVAFTNASGQRSSTGSIT